MRVMIDSFNLDLEKGTGVATYGRNLLASLHDMGFSVGCLTERGIKAGESAPFQFYSADRKDTFFHGKKGMLRLPYDLFSTLLPFKIQLLDIEQVSHIELGAITNKFPEIDFFVAKKRIFNLALAYFKIFGKFLPIRLNQPLDVMHWTYPLPARVVGARNFYTIHDIIPLKFPFYTLENKDLYNRTLKEIALRADAVVVVSEQTRHDFCGLFKLDNSRVFNAYQTIDWDFVNSETETKGVAGYLKECFALSPGEYFIFTGALEPKKNVERLIEAYLLAGVEFPLVLVGPQGWQVYDGLKTLMKKTPSILYLDYLPRRTLQILTKHARALLFPSIYEGFGLPLLEAMKSGTPVLTADFGAMAEIVGEAALRVDPYNVSDMAQAIRQLAKDKTRLAELAALGLKQAEMFSAENYQMRLHKIYKDSQKNN